MASFTERLAILITADGKAAVNEFSKVGQAAEKNLGKTDNTLQKVGSRMQVVGAGAVAFAAVGAGALKKFADAGSDLAESQSKVGVVFGESAGDIRAWAKTASTSLGQSEQQALEAAGTFGNLFTAMKITQPAAAEMSKKIVGLAADLASFNNENPEDVLLALRSGLVGEAEPLRKFGVNLSAARIEAKALQLGLAENKDALDAGAKAQAAYAIILEDTKNAQGDFARTADGAANQQRILSAQFKDLQANIGQGLLPIFKGLLGVSNDVLGAFNDLDAGTQSMIGSVAGIAVAGTGALGVLSLVAGSALKARDNFSRLNTEFPKTARGLKTIGIAAGVVGTAFAGIQILDSLGVLEDFGGTADEAALSLSRLAKSGQTTGTAAKAFGENWETFGKAIKATADTSLYDNIQSGVDAVHGAIDRILPGTTDFGVRTKDFADAVGKLDDELTTLVEHGEAEKAATVFDLFKDKARENNISLDLLESAFGDYQRALADSTKAGETHALGLTGLATSTNAVVKGISETSHSLDTQKRAAKAAKDELDRYKDTLDAIFGVQLNTEKATIAYEASLDDLTATVKENGRTLDVNTEKGRANRSAILDSTDAATDLAKAMIDQTHNTDAANFILTAHFNRLTDAGKAAGITEQETLDYVKAVLQIPPEQATTITNNAQLAQYVTEQYKGALGTVPKEVTTTFKINSFWVDQFFANFRNSLQGLGLGLTGKAAGGPVSANTPYVVGEDGPELFVPSTSGQIVPNSRVRTGGAGGNVVYLSVAINNPSGNGDELADSLVTSLKSGRNAAELRRVLAGV